MTTHSHLPSVAGPRLPQLINNALTRQPPVPDYPKIKGVARLSRLLPTLPLLTLLLGCKPAGNPGTAAAASAPKNPELVIPTGRDADDVGRFLAGMPGREGSPFHDLEDNETWLVHRKEFDRLWRSFEENRAPAMRDFQKKEISGPPFDKAVIFYPFSGPDVLTIETFFPGHNEYLLIGLEPPGTLPTRKGFKPDALARRLPNMRATLVSLLGKSFFVTREMDRQFRGQVTDGLLPAMLVQLVRAGYDVTGFRYTILNPQGELVEREEEGHTSYRPHNQAVTIAFRKPNGPLQRITYLTANLANDRFGQNKDLLAFLDHHKGMVTYFKSTSYMTHKDEFSLIRDQVLSLSSAVMQDDSGIPFKFFDPARWQVQLYGDYEKPYGSFRYLVQPDLKAAYDKGEGIKPLAFRIGYGFGRTPSNLLIAKRRN